MARILIVEDDELVREMVIQFLRGENYEVVEAETGDAALDILSECTFDLIFTDIVMPGATDGFALIKHVRAKYPTVPILCTTGYGELKHKIPADHACCGTLDKPFRLAELRTIIERALRRQEGRPIDAVTRAQLRSA